MKNILKYLSRQSDSPGVIYGYDKYLDKKESPKKALLSYLVNPLLSDRKLYNFSNAGIAVTWPKILNQLGFSVDIIDWSNSSFSAENTYDLIIMHGGANTESLHRAVRGDTVLIYFASGCYWQFHNRQEKARFDYFEHRHGVSLPPDRMIEASEEEANRIADGIICLGNKFTESTFSRFKNVYSLKIGSYMDAGNLKQDKDIEVGRKNFLFFSGNGNVHKGLDLLLDTFAGLPDYHLHICTNLDPEFEEFYNSLLYKSGNIHFHGFVPPSSAKFYSLTRRCNYIVLPSCSEGNPGSVVDCMRQGLVPLVSREAGLDTENFGITLARTDLESLKKAIIKLSNESITDLKEKSKNALNASAEYSPGVFEAGLKKYVKMIYEGAAK